jgi:indole-3-glycerol phosphate synthase
VEVHDESEVERALALGAGVIGVNARDLRTLEVRPETFERLSRLLPSTVLSIAESGIRTAEDVRQYAHWGADAVLVGEALVVGGTPKEQVAEFRAAGVIARS